MSTCKLNIQLFGGGGSWTQGVTVSAINTAFDTFKSDCEAAKEAINNYSNVDAALQAGWSGDDCTQYLEKFHQHAANVCAEIDEYVTAVRGTLDKIIDQWAEFQAGLIS
jgi:uncharacterized protein YukE